MEWDKVKTVYCFLGTNGFWNGRIAQEAIWNRTVNLHGGLGRNIPMDLANEFLNKDFKGLL